MVGQRVIALDLMDTVVVDPFFALLPRQLGRTAAELMRDLEPGTWREFELGLIDEATYLSRMLSPAADGRFTPEEVRHIILTGYAFVPGMEPLLEELTAAGACLWALTNYPPWIDQLRARLELDRFFAGYIASHQVGVRKPDPGAFTALCEQARVPPAQVLFVDDRPENIHGARAHGMSAVLFTDAARLRQDLRGAGVL